MAPLPKTAQEPHRLFVFDGHLVDERRDAVLESVHRAHEGDDLPLVRVGQNHAKVGRFDLHLSLAD